MKTGNLVLCGVTSGVIVLAVLLAQVPNAAQGRNSEMSQRELQEQTLSESNAEEQARNLKLAREKLDKKLFREASLIAGTCLNRHPSSEAFELYAVIHLQAAALAAQDARYMQAENHFGQAGNAVELWKQHIARVGDVGSTAIVVEMEDRVEQQADKIALSIVKEAEKLRESGRRRWWRDKREPIIDALVLLDAVDPSLLSAEVRKRHSQMWTEYYGMLGKREIEKYKVRSNLQNS